jgi:dTDP-4-dehydrorhamnose 3,5-epimerase
MRAEVGEKQPVAVYIPPSVVHAYKCISKQRGLVVNLPDKLYAGIQRGQDVDEVRYEERENTLFVLD